MIEDVNRAGGKTTVKNVRIKSRIKIQGIIIQVFITFESMYLSNIFFTLGNYAFISVTDFSVFQRTLWSELYRNM